MIHYCGFGVIWIKVPLLAKRRGCAAQSGGGGRAVDAQEGDAQFGLKVKLELHHIFIDSLRCGADQLNELGGCRLLSPRRPV